ncbi:cytidylyltransferase domain-containing protein [Peribacillus sp. NPDC097295]|uniref:cytidylyltransferase domain-containing protein n=1 Tax=Peribacillus sp. NPDC097295 TaxID=3364402 RepID=UPI0038256F55
MKVVAIIQARMGSSRLPGKVMKQVQGKPLLQYQLERIGKARLINKIVVATTTKETEQPIVDLCERLSVAIFRGPEDDVLTRFFDAATEHQTDIVVRLTADCPLIDPHTIDQALVEFLADVGKYDYVSNTLVRTYPRGFDVEVFSMKALAQAFKEAKEAAYREHVTPYIYHHPKKFKLASFLNGTDFSSLRLTVDTEDDLELITRLLEHLYEKEDFTLEDITKLLKDKPEWSSINSHIEQKEVFTLKESERE